MKSIYRKGKIHPSPAAGSAPSTTVAAVEAVLRLLPTAIVVLTAALGSEDKEVLAYMVTRSLKGLGAAEAEEGKRCRRPGRPHRPRLDCGCFDCYTSYWSRWDCSPDRELIHQAIEAFEEHLASSERSAAATRGGGRGRRREKGKKSKDKEKNKAEQVAVAVESAVEENKATEEVAMEAVGLNNSFSAKDKLDTEELEVETEAEMREVDEEEMVEEEEAVGGSEMAVERRRGWPDVMGLFNSRLWSLWSPGM